LFHKGDNWPVRDDVNSTYIDVALYREIMKGAKVYLDFSSNLEGFLFDDLPEAIKTRYCRESEIQGNEENRTISPYHRLEEINSKVIVWLKDRGVNLKNNDNIEIAPAVQHFQGGVKINSTGETAITNLFAAGECAGGQHGANRPGGNALMDCQVFGKITGHEAARRSGILTLLKSDIKTYVNNLIANFQSGNSELEKAEKTVQKIMYEGGAIIRSDEKLKESISNLEQIKTEGIKYRGNPVYRLMELRNMTDTGLSVLHSALLRKESRGPHLYFSSYDDVRYVPRKGKEWERYCVVYIKNGNLTTEYRDGISPAFPSNVK